MLNKKYLLTESSGRIRGPNAVKAYQQIHGIEIFNEIENDIAEHDDLLKTIRGKLESAYCYFNNPEPLLEEPEDEESLLAWATQNEAKHPPWSTYFEDYKGMLDYIFFTKESMRVTRILDLPSIDEVCSEKDLPNKLFPSDHLRM